jgi:hypothetical protein
MYQDNKTLLAARVWSVATIGSVKSDGFISFLEIVEAVNFDSVNLVNLVGKDLWLSGVHLKITWRTFILVYTNNHTRGGNIRSM